MTDTDTDTEAQIERAVERWRHVVGSEYKVRTLLQEFAAGKFREPELPAIAAPPFPCLNPFVQREFPVDSEGKARVYVYGHAGWNALAGPWCETPLKAIEVWNAVFGPKGVAEPPDHWGRP